MTAVFAGEATVADRLRAGKAKVLITNNQRFTKVQATVRAARLDAVQPRQELFSETYFQSSLFPYSRVQCKTDRAERQPGN